MVVSNCDLFVDRGKFLRMNKTACRRQIGSLQKTNCMKRSFALYIMIFFSSSLIAQKLPCNQPEFRQFDFWIGEWEAFGKNGKKGGDSRISLILDSCIILEEWTSAGVQQGLRYAGKSFNTWNAAAKQWQQTWVDNTGNTTAFTKGRFENNKIIFTTDPFPFSKDTMAIRRLTFFNLGIDKVRQFGEISKDKGTTWLPEYDLEYRRKK